MPPRAAAPGLSTASGDARYQPLGPDLTAIEALGTTTTGRNKLIEAAPVKDPASPYSVASKVREIVFTGGTAATINLPALSDLEDLEIIWVRNQSASTVVITGDPPTGATLNGAADGVSATFTLLARGMVGFQRLSSTTWGSVQPGSLTVNAVRAYFADGVAYAQSANIAPDGTITLIGPAVAATAADPTAFLIVGSGANVSYPSGIVGSGSALGSTATRWTWVLSDLGITLPSGPVQTVCNVSVTSFAEGTRGGAASFLLWGLGTSPTAPSSLVGFARTTSGPAWNYGFLTSTTAANATGTAGLTRVSGVRVVGDSTNTEYAMWRYEGTDMSGSVQNQTGPSVTTTPTHVGLYAMVNAGTTTGSWTVTAPIFTMRWNTL